jgi:hypothetical protein
MSKAGSIVGSALADLTTGVMGTAGNLVNFGAAAMGGTAKVSDFFAAFKDLPIVGTVASLFSGLVKLQEEALVSFQQLSSSGVDLGGSLTQLRMNAFAAGLNLQEYTKILKENSDTLVQMGGSASLGAKNFNGISKAMRDSGLTQQLLHLGFTAEEANNTILQYAKTTGGISKQALTDQAGLAASSARYGKELDFLARLTGESREALQKKLEEEAMEANWQAFLASKDQETRDKLTDGLQKYTTVAGKAGAQIFKAGAQGMAILGDEGQLTASLMGDLTDTITKDARRANDRTVSAQAYFASSTRNMALAQTQSAKGYQQNASLFQALQAAGDPLGAQMGAHAKNYQTLTNSQGQLNLSVEENVRRLEEERKEALKKSEASKTEAAAMLEMNQAIRTLGLQLWDAMKPLMPLVTDIISFVGKKLPEAGEKISWFIKSLFSEKGRNDILDNIATFVKELFGKIWDLVKPWWATETAATIASYTAGGTVAGTAIGATAGGIGAIPGAAVGALTGLVSGIVAAVIDYVQKPSGRSAGSWGTVGSAFENFGSGTPIIAHGEEGVFTPSQINQLMAAGTGNNLKELISQLNNTQAELVYQMRQVAENSRRNVQATESLSGNAFA